MNKEQKLKLQDYIDNYHPKSASDLPYPVWEDLAKNNNEPFLWEEIDTVIVDDYMIYNAAKRRK